MPFQVEAPAVAETPVAPAAATEEAKEGEAELRLGEEVLVGGSRALLSNLNLSRGMTNPYQSK